MTGDWTSGQPRITYQRCRTCQQVWYFARDFCPRCGTTEPEAQVASGYGTVYSVTVVHGVSGSRDREQFAIVLVDAAEGFRLMGLAQPGLTIGDGVVAQYSGAGDTLRPFFVRRPGGHGDA
jgi:uncharacterized OB-fold protein